MKWLLWSPTNHVYEGMKVRDLNEKGKCKVLLEEQLRMEHIREDGDKVWTIV